MALVVFKIWAWEFSCHRRCVGEQWTAYSDVTCFVKQAVSRKLFVFWVRIEQLLCGVLRGTATRKPHVINIRQKTHEPHNLIRFVLNTLGWKEHYFLSAATMFSGLQCIAQRAVRTVRLLGSRGKPRTHMRGDFSNLLKGLHTMDLTNWDTDPASRLTTTD